ncbi:MAG: glycosyltransferase [Motiliproteus sp.]
MSDIESPLVSVCIPTYKGSAHLTATIDSVLKQTLTDFELIIIDDCSPDDTVDLVRRYNDPRLRYICNAHNLGPEGNWNRCLQEAKGRYFKLLPQDDLLYPDTLQRQVDILQNDPESQVALVFGARNIIDAQGKTITKRGLPGGREGRVAGTGLVRRCVRFGTNLIGEPGSVLMRKALADKVGLFDGDVGYVIDLDYWVRLLSHGDAYYQNSVVSAFRVSGGSWSVAIGTSQSREYRRFIDKLSARPVLGLSRLDRIVGGGMAGLNNVMRLLFYRFVLKNME